MLPMMLSTMVSTMAVFVCALAVAPEAAAEQAAEPARETVDLSRGVKNRTQARKPSWDGVTIQAPPRAKVINGPDVFGVSLGEGTGFQIALSNKKVDIAAKRRALVASKFSKPKRFTVDTKDALVYEVATKTATKPSVSWHFVGNVDVSGSIFSCRDMSGPDNYSQADVDAMWAACQTLARMKKVKP